ncbi:hypothetical protein SprV_0902680400 [Sparganum proliferum]
MDAARQKKSTEAFAVDGLLLLALDWSANHTQQQYQQRQYTSSPSATEGEPAEGAEADKRPARERISACKRSADSGFRSRPGTSTDACSSSPDLHSQDREADSDLLHNSSGPDGTMTIDNRSPIASLPPRKVEKLSLAAEGMAYCRECSSCFCTAAKTALNLAAQSGFARIVDLLIKADRFRTKHPNFAEELAKNLRGVADRNDSSASISETGTFTGSLSPSEFEQRSKEAGVVLINDQIVVLGSQSATAERSPERSEDSDFSISQASTYKSSDSEAPSSKMSSSSSAAAVATSRAGSGLANGTTAETKQTPTAKTESLASNTASGMKIQRDQRVEEDSGSHVYENVAPDRGRKRSTLSELASRARADRQSGSVASTEVKADQKQAKNGSLVYENVPSGRDSALPLRKPSTGVSRPNSAAGTPASELPSSQRVYSIAGDHGGAGGAQIVTKDSSGRKVSAPTSRGGEQIKQPGVYIAQTSPGSLAGSEGLSQISQMEYRLLTFNQTFAAQFQPLLYHLAYNKLKKEDWKKLAVFWGFTDEQIAAIELHHSQSPKAYKDHGFRMLSIWLHGVEANETPTEGLSAALIAIGEKSRADKLQQDYHKVLHGHKSWRDKLDVSSRRRRSVL